MVLWTVPVLLLTAIGGSLVWFGEDPAGSVVKVSQRGREFQPAQLTIDRNDVTEIINDDGDFTHHAYVDAPDFKFDSADQQPGHSVQIRFNRSGEFDVLCGIHPKMRLSVRVR